MYCACMLSVCLSFLPNLIKLTNHSFLLGKFVQTKRVQHKPVPCPTRLDNSLRPAKERRPSQETKGEQTFTRQLLDANKRIKELKDEKQKLKNEKYALELSNAALQQKNDQLEEGLKNFEKQNIRQLQCEGKVCDKNCVSLAIRWICQEKLESVKISGCGSQLENIITAYCTGKGKTEKANLKCGHFLDLLMNCGIVYLPEGNEYSFTDETSKKLEMIMAWSNLVSMDEGVCMLAIKNPDATGEGHVVVCDLDTKKDGNIMFHDPQAPPSEREEEMCQETFIVYVNDSEAIKLYMVDLKLLDEIIGFHQDILHNTEEIDQTFDNAPQAK